MLIFGQLLGWGRNRALACLQPQVSWLCVVTTHQKPAKEAKTSGLGCTHHQRGCYVPVTPVLMLTKVLDPDSEQQRKIKFRGWGRQRGREGRREGGKERWRWRREMETRRNTWKQRGRQRTRQSQGKQVTLLDLRSHEIFMDPWFDLLSCLPLIPTGVSCLEEAQGCLHLWCGFWWVPCEFTEAEQEECRNQVNGFRFYLNGQLCLRFIHVEWMSYLVGRIEWSAAISGWPARVGTRNVRSS